MAKDDRIEWIDCWKGLLILLVVAGHVMGAGSALSSGFSANVLRGINVIINSFHMPAFFIIAGICWHTSKFEVYLKKKFFRLIIPYFCFGLFSIFVYWSLIGYENIFQPFLSLLHAGKWPNGEGFKCNSVLWFLPCMFVVEVAYWTVVRFLHGIWLRLFFAVGLVVLVYWTSCATRWYPWGISLIPWFLPFCILGGVFIRKDSKLLVHSGWLGRLGQFVGAVGIVVLLNWLVSGVVKIGWLGFALSFTCACCSAMMAQALSGTVGATFVRLGKSSLGIMLLHKFFVVACQERVILIRRMFGDSLIVALFGCMVVTVVSVAASLFLTSLLRQYCPIVLGERKH